MSQVLEIARQGSDFSEFDGEFSYRPVLGLTIVACVMAMISLFGLLFWAVLPVAVLGMAVAAISLMQLYRAAGEYRGFAGSWISLVTCVMALVVGTGSQLYAYRHEVPPGFERLNFTTDISKKGFIVEKDVGMRPHPDVVALEGKKVFLKGYVYPEKQTEGLRGFLFCRDAGECCFGGKPKPEDKIGVLMKDGKTIDFYPGKVAVAGTFRLNPNYRGEQDPVYLMDGEFYSPAQSDF